MLHFDLNNTILMNDRSKGLNTVQNVSPPYHSRVHQVHRIVCKSAWGRMTKQFDGNLHWQLCHDQLSFNKPAECNLLANLPEIETESEIIAYEDYLCKKCPAPKDATPEQSDAYKAELAEMRSKFAAQGGLGSKFRSQQEKLLKTLTLPKGAKEELGIVGDEGMAPAEE